MSILYISGDVTTIPVAFDLDIRPEAGVTLADNIQINVSEGSSITAMSTAVAEKATVNLPDAEYTYAYNATTNTVDVSLGGELVVALPVDAEGKSSNVTVGEGAVANVQVNGDGTIDPTTEPTPGGGGTGETFTLNTDTQTIQGTDKNDTINGTQSTYLAGDIIIDPSTEDADNLNLTTTSSITATPTVSNVENVNITVSKVGGFTFDAANISGANTFTVNRADVMDGAIDGTGAVTISNARAATFVSGEKTTGFTVGMQAAGNTGTAAVVDATTATGDVAVTGIGFAGTTVNGIVDQDVSVTEAAAASTKATVNASGEVGVTNAVDELTLNALDTSEFTLNAISDKLTLGGDGDITLNIAGDALTTEEVVNNATGVVNVVLTAASTLDLDLTDLAAVTSVVLGADFNDETITAKSDQLITTKTNQSATLYIINSVTTGTGTARFAVLDNEDADNGVTATTLTFGDGTNDFSEVYIDATADELDVTTALVLNDADLVLTGDKDIDFTTVTNAQSITSASTGDITLVSAGNTANEQVIATGTGADDVTVNSATGLFVVNLGAGNNTLTITDALADSAFVTGAGNDSVTLTNAQGAISITTGAGNDTISFGTAAGVTWADTTINGGEGTDKLSVMGNKDISGATLTSIDQVEVATGTTLTIDAEQFNGLASFDLLGAGTLTATHAGETTGVTLDGSDINLGFGVTAVTVLTGGDGDDTITSSETQDTMTGNAGDDTFVFASGSGNTDTIVDIIADFTTAADSLKLGTAGTATNFAADTTTRADAAAALAQANTLADGTVQFIFTNDITDPTDLTGAQAGDGLFFVDWDLDGTVDQTIIMVGLSTAGDVVASDIIA